MRLVALSRPAAAGFALAVGGAIGLVSLDAVATAHARATGSSSYLVVLTSGSGLALIDNHAPATVATGSTAAPAIRCQRIVRLAGVAAGYGCRTI